MKTSSITIVSALLAVTVALALIASPTGIAAADPGSGNWWEVAPEPFEAPIPYPEAVYYSQIAPRLREIEQASNRVRVEVIGQSAAGRNLFLVTLSAPETMGRLGHYQAIRQAMLRDPEHAQELIDRFGDFKVPVFINASIHGGETTGVDAAIRLIETLAFDDTPEVQAILDNEIVLINVVQNPDGRVLGTRANANGIDINRDFITQSQPETRATVKIFTEWNPMITLDLHGFVNPMLIEPCTPPHNPNYEYDLYIQWAFYQARAMEDELFAHTGFSAQIPYRDDPLGWDDWPPTYTPMYGMYHGSYGHTMETPYRDYRGVEAHYWATWGALKFAAQNREAMVRDQVEIFRRGFLDLPQMRIPDQLLDETQWDQWNNLDLVDFPTAYVIPPDAPWQQSDQAVARLVEFLLFNNVQVEQAVGEFSVGGTTYPKGSYIVWMDQPKRGLANTILEAGPDLSNIPGLYFYSPPSVWSLTHLWGTRAAVVQDWFETQTAPVLKADSPKGSVLGGAAKAYAFQPSSLAAFRAVSELLKRGEMVYRLSQLHGEGGAVYPAGTFLVNGIPALANELATQWALDLTALKVFPVGAVQLHQPLIAVRGDSGVTEALKSLGLDYTLVSNADLNAGAVVNYEVLINLSANWSNLNAAGRASLASWLAAGGDYIGLLSRGAQVARNLGLNVNYSETQGNAIVWLDYTPGDALAAGYPAQDSAFVYSPLWFTSVGAGVQVAASYQAGSFLVSGFWPNWSTGGAAGMPAIVHAENGLSDVTVFGIDNTFRGHPENTFRLLGNAIYGAQE